MRDQYQQHIRNLDNSIAKKGETNNLIKKKSTKIEQAFFQRHTNGQRVYEKVLNITNRNTKLQRDITSHPVRMTIIKKR